MMIPFFRTPFNYDTDKASDESGLQCCDPSLADQSAAEECDINTIVRRFGLTGHLPENMVEPMYADIEQQPSFHEAMSARVRANETWNSLPEAVRRKFGSVLEMIDFCSRGENQAEIDALGLGPERVPVKSAEGQKPEA